MEIAAGILKIQEEAVLKPNEKFTNGMLQTTL